MKVSRRLKGIRFLVEFARIMHMGDVNIHHLPVHEFLVQSPSWGEP